jgi:hypothetical protein
LPEERIDELKRAVGLFSHGIGVGSFVYLRRVFEFLINEAYENGKLGGDVNEELFKKARMNEKIDMLENYLPEILTKNKQWYGIVSAGIHSLSEEECNQAFNTLEKTITIILDEKLAQYLKQQKEKDLEKELSKISKMV